jgi:hypothetical protein
LNTASPISCADSWDTSPSSGGAGSLGCLRGVMTVQARSRHADAHHT